MVARHWGDLSRGGGLATDSDAVLLERFRRRRDEPAFAALVQRHGPMVRAVCRRIVRDPHTADDAFQAVFLVLARKGGSVRQADRLGPWLHRVAVRVATRAARDAKQRLTREVLLPTALDQATAPLPTGLDPDQAALLHAEIDRLPDRDRLPIVLCDLQGLTHEQAAARLGWPVGSVKGRQSRARDRLRDRLSRRGLTAPLTLITATLASDAKAVIPATLAAQTASLVLNALTSATATVAATAAALTLARGVQVPMWFSPLKLTALAALLGGGLIATQAPGPGPADPAQAATGSQPDATRPKAELPDRPAQAGNTPSLDARGRTLVRQDGPGGMLPLIPRPDLDLDPGPGGSPYARPISAEERAHLETEVEQAIVDEEFLETGLALTRDTIDQLSRRIRDQRLQLIEVDDDAEAARLKAVTDRLAVDLQVAQAEYRKGLDRRREIRQRKAQAERSLQAPSTEPTRFKPGDLVQVEVLEALPGRPIMGTRRVQSDGTISLGWYGDLQISGLDRNQAKLALIKHLRYFLTDEVLGIVGMDEQNHWIQVPPVESNRLFIREVDPDTGEVPTLHRSGTTIEDIDQRLSRIMKKLDALQQSDPKPNDRR